MNFEEYLKNKQPLVYSTFLNAKRNNKIAQAYLIKGESGAPTLETAKYLAKSLICKHSDTFACNECDECKRFDSQNYTDLIILNAQTEALKVADIDELEKRFSTSSMEKGGKMIYIIHHVENMNRESVNALLKFLEEPNENIYAFLTTENETKVLPTILSRCQHLKLISLSKREIINEAKKEGISEDDAELLANFSNEINSLVNLSQSETYLLVKGVFIDYLDALSKSLSEGYYYIQREAITKIKTKEQIRLFVDMLSILFKDMLNVQMGMESLLPSLESFTKKISSYIVNKSYCYNEIMFTRGRIELNITVSLLLEHLGYIIYKGAINNG